MTHMKRLTIPRTWPIPRKIHTWAIRPTLGPHPLKRSIPLLLLVRDYLHYADTASEARKIINTRSIMIDGTVRTDPKFPCGLMDVVSIPTAKEYYRILIDSRGFIRVVPITAKEATWKLCRIEGKTTLKGGKVQLNLHDGLNIIVEEQYKSGDVIQLAVPEKSIKSTISYEAGTLGLVINGKHVGEIATIKNIDITKSSRPNVVHLEGFSTIKHYVFPVGKEKPLIKLPEVTLYD